MVCRDYAAHLNREWTRLLKCGGHTRKDKKPRPMSAKTVRNIAGVVSSAFARAIQWGLVSTNPVTNSEPPRVKKHLAIALTPAQQSMLLEAASGPGVSGPTSRSMRPLAAGGANYSHYAGQTSSAAV